jgi:hypothetical protein
MSKKNEGTFLLWVIFVSSENFKTTNYEEKITIWIGTGLRYFSSGATNQCSGKREDCSAEQSGNEQSLS